MQPMLNTQGVDYELVSADSPDELIRKVYERISAGWSPEGGPVVFNGQLLQAIVSTEDSRQIASRLRY